MNIFSKKLGLTKKEVLGYSQSIIYIVTLSISTIWVEHLGNNFSTVFLLFFSTLTATVFFNLFRLKKIIRNHLTITKSPLLWVKMNFYLLGTWSLTYYTTIHSSATSCLSVIFLVLATCAAIQKKQKLKTSLAVILVIAIYFLSSKMTVFTMFTGVLAGISAYFYSIISLHYAVKHNMKALDVLSIRFYFILLLTIIIILIYRHEHILLIYQHGLITIIVTLILLGIINMILPNILSQNAVYNINPQRFAFIVSFVPVTVYFLRGMFLRQWSISMLIACLLASIILNFEKINLIIRTNDTKR
ncbi:MAG: hypothetical protein AAGA27_03400 [Pseudomonadota bacterium]